MLQDFSEADEAVTRSKKGYHDGQKNKVSKIQEETVSLASQTQMVKLLFTNTSEG